MFLKKFKGGYILFSDENVLRRNLEDDDRYAWFSDKDRIVMYDSKIKCRVRKIIWTYNLPKNDSISWYIRKKCAYYDGKRYWDIVDNN